MEPLTVTVETMAGHTRVRLQGEIDIATAEAFASALDNAVEHPAVSSLELDLGDVSFIDCSGLRVLVAVRQAMEDKGGTVSLIRRSSAVDRLLSAAGLDEHLHVPGTHVKEPIPAA
ncbi:STAS domain-containing protein [Nonomuraea muscovyensis]|uniref:Anti-sigma factor antagonist n=1 Tax=Nonomuraea muscovyensis TaxID=1124761 RepID=A0A7X0C4T3_9ACTN|nr:STAS domain-containing protein [Nonomuraea muscovyensis]MBB6348158.1 anti-anti-sigma factor [Nonomuraea muscovyensis]